MQKTIVITTINPLTRAIEEFRRIAPDWDILLVGDKRSVSIKSSEGVHFVDVAEQQRMEFRLAKSLPYNHYVRKNLGYLFALKKGADSIYDTDDDNIPYESWGFPPFDGSYRAVSGTRYFNVYGQYAETLIWPRGYPLDEVRKQPDGSIEVAPSLVGVWQGLADLDPDVDAIYRLLLAEEVRFSEGEPLVLSRGVFCPFNSQNTLWERSMLPYAYLPATVTFRFTDILRGYIAQRCLWEHGRLLGFTAPTVYQERNVHDFMKDFESEVPCYLDSRRVVEILEDLNLNDDWERNLRVVYGELVKAGIVQEVELGLLDDWTDDLKRYL